MWIGGLPSAHETWLRCDEFQMGLVTQALGLSNGKLALVDFGSSQRRCRRRQERRIVFCCFFLIAPEELGHRPLMSPPVVVRRTRNRRRVVRVQTETRRLSSHCRLQRG